MALSLEQLRDAATQAGVPEPFGVPLRSLVAAIAKAESGGDPFIGAGDNGESLGLLQINRPTWPTIAAKVDNVMRASPRPSEEAEAMAQMMLAAPVMKLAGETAAKALATLGQRGLAPSNALAAFMILFDAAWQHKPETVLKWAATTPNGDVADIDPRSVQVGAYLSALRVPGFGLLTPRSPAADIFLLLGGMALIAALIYALIEWSDSNA